MSIRSAKHPEAKEKYLANLSPEEREEIEKTKKEAEARPGQLWKAFSNLINEDHEANAQHETALGILKRAIQSASEDPAMTREIKGLAELFILLIDERNMREYDPDRFFDPVIKVDRSESGKNAANARYSRDQVLRDEIIRTWASGKYSSRDRCAEEEYSAVGFGSLKTARNALTGTPDPSPWPAKKIKK